jgi:IS1 family transposase
MRPGPWWEKKDKQCDPDDPDDAEQGSYWDHVIIDPETKLIVSLVVGRRNADTVVVVFTDFFDRTGGYLPELITTDGYAVYETVILATYGVWREELKLTAAEEAEFDRNGMPQFYFPVEITYAKVLKEKEGGRVVDVSSEVVLGSAAQAEETLAESERSQTINTSFVERWFGTQRQFNARKKRKAYTFSKELSFHEASTWLLVVWYNFGWCVRTLRQKVQEGPPRYHDRTPAMAAGLADHAWTMPELLCYPLYPPKDSPQRSKLRTYKEVLERLEGVVAAEAPA